MTQTVLSTEEARAIRVKAMVQAVREHAKANYEKDGWDYVVECWEDEDILKAIGNAGTIDSAIRNVRRVVTVMDSRRKDIEAEAF